MRPFRFEKRNWLNLSLEDLGSYGEFSVPGVSGRELGF